jgi:2'-5' RNA ligase
VADCLALAVTPDEVRAVFAEARLREQEAEEQRTTDAQGREVGVMVAFFLPRDAAKRLALDAHAIPGALPPSDMHITLAVLGRTTDYADPAGTLDRLKRAVATFAEDGGFDALHGAVSGIGRFNPGPHSDGKAPIYASVNVPELQELRATLVASLEGVADVKVDTTFAYTPHITLAYVPTDAPTPVTEVPPVDFTLSEVTLAWGGERYAYALGEGHGGAVHPSADAEVGTLVRDAAADLVVRELQQLRADVLAPLRY